MDFFFDLLAAMIDGDTADAKVVERAAVFADAALQQAEERWKGVEL